jgi:hypothetical protein
MFLPIGDPFPITGASGVDFSLTLSNVGSNGQAIPAVALIVARPELMDAPAAASGSYGTATGTTHHITDLSGVSNKFMAQAGVFVSLASGTTPTFLTGILRANLVACSRAVGRRAIEVPSNQTYADPTMYLLGRVPASSANNLRAALIMEGSKDIEYRFMVRGVNDPDAPGSWTALGTVYTAFSDGNSATCAADVSVSGVSPSSYHTLEFGLALRMRSGGSSPAGQLRVMATLSYS